MDRSPPEILVEFHLAKLHRVGSYKDCIVVYPEPNAAAYDSYCITPPMPHETPRKGVNCKRRACKGNRKYPFIGNPCKTVIVPKETEAHVLQNKEPAVLSDDAMEAYHSNQFDAKVREIVKEE